MGFLGRGEKERGIFESVVGRFFVFLVFGYEGGGSVGRGLDLFSIGFLFSFLW